MIYSHVCPGCERVTVTSKKFYSCGCVERNDQPRQPSVWDALHQYAIDHWRDWDAAAAGEAYRNWASRIPNAGCGSCMANWDAYTAEHPPEFESAEAFFAWGVAAHNHVSVFHVAEYRPTLSLREAAQLYGFPADDIAWRRKPISEDPTIAFLACTYIRVGGTETFHQTLLPRLPNVAGLGVAGLCDGDPKKLGVPLKCPKELAVRADVLVTWGVDRLVDYLPNPRPKVISVHHADWASTWSNQVTLSQLEMIDEVVCVHPDVADRISRMTDKPVHYVPNCIDPARITPTGDAQQLRERWEIAASDRIVFFAHRLSNEKQPLLAIEIAKYLPDGYTLVIAGEGPQRTACDAAAQSVRNIRLVGLVDTPANWLSQSACFLSLSTFEGFGLSIGEAMLAGVPVLSTPTGIALTPGLCSTLPHDAHASLWASRIVDLLSDDTVSQTAAAQQHCLAHWSIDQFTSRWLSILRGP